MKIAYLISSCSTGGAELLVRRLSAALTSSDVEIQLWVMCRARDSYEVCSQSILDYETDYIADMEQRGITVCFLEKRKNKNRLAACHAIRRLFKSFRPDIVHAHSEICALYMVAALWGLHAKCIQTIHSSNIFHRSLVKYVLAPKVQAFVSISDDVTDVMLKAAIPHKKISVITNGISIKQYTFPEREFLKEPVELIAVGRMAKEKDYPFLLKSFKQAIMALEETEEKPPHLSIVGTGLLFEEIQQMVKDEHLVESVSLLGLRSDIAELLKKADMFVMSSAFEGLSLALIEAAASGLPIVATDVGSNHRLVKNELNGVLVTHGDVDGFADAIVSIVSNVSLRRDYSIKSAEIASDFDIRNTAKLHMELYLNLLKNS